jgi:hypothetical protein
MRDTLRYTTERRGGRVVAVIHGSDDTGRPLTFEVAPATLRHNLRVQADWAGHVAYADKFLQAWVKAGIDPDRVWPLVEVMLPADFDMIVNDLAADESGPDFPHQLFQCGDDIFGDATDGKR